MGNYFDLLLKPFVPHLGFLLLVAGRLLLATKDPRAKNNFLLCVLRALCV